MLIVGEFNWNSLKTLALKESQSKLNKLNLWEKMCSDDTFIDMNYGGEMVAAHKVIGNFPTNFINNVRRHK